MIEYTEIDYDECRQESAAAVLIVVASGDAVWVPRSLLDNGEQIPIMNDHGGEHGACFVQRWFCEKRGLV